MTSTRPTKISSLSGIPIAFLKTTLACSKRPRRSSSSSIKPAIASEPCGETTPSRPVLIPRLVAPSPAPALDIRPPALPKTPPETQPAKPPHGPLQQNEPPPGPRRQAPAAPAKPLAVGLTANLHRRLVPAPSPRAPLGLDLEPIGPALSPRQRPRVTLRRSLVKLQPLARCQALSRPAAPAPRQQPQSGPEKLRCHRHPPPRPTWRIAGQNLT